MAKESSWGDERTDPGEPEHASGETVVGRAKRSSKDVNGKANGRPASRAKVHLGPSGGGADLPPTDKTNVVHVDNLAPGSTKDDATAIVSNPLLDDEGVPVSPSGNSDATMVTSNPLAAGRGKQKRVLGRLVVVAGREEGRVIEITEGTRTLGRGRECDITLLDIQISRRHVELTADHNGVKLSDLGSGNGTFVNEDPVESVSLVHGDQVSLGDHQLRFEEEGPVGSALPALARRGPVQVAARPSGGVPASPSEVVRRARQRRAKGGDQQTRKRLLMIAGGALVAVAVAGMALGLRSDTDSGEIAEPPLDQVAQQVFAEGMEHFRENRYEDALERFEQVVADVPDHREAGRYVAAARREIAARRAIDQGNAHLGLGDFEGARQQLGQVEQDSLRYQDAVKLLEKVDEAEAKELVGEGDSLLEDDELADAREVYRRALAVVSDFGPARDGLDRVEAREDELRNMTRAQRARQARLAKQRRQAAQSRAQAQVRRALAVGERQFDQGEFQRALDTFAELSQSGNRQVATQARRKAEAIRAFRPAYERGMSAADSRAAEQAVRDLAVAERQSRIVNANGAIHREVRGRLADMYGVQGRIAFNGQRYQAAYQSWTEALKVAPQHAYSQRGMTEIREIAEQKYLEAYTVRSLNPESAIRMFRQVIAMTPRDFTYNERARQRLAELEN